MTKGLLRLAVIMAVCLAIMGGIYWLVESQGMALGLNDVDGLMERRGLGPSGDGEEVGLERPQETGMRSERGDHEGGGIGRGLAGIARNLGVVALITTGVVLAQRVWVWVWRMRRSGA